MQAIFVSLLLTSATPIPPVDCNAPRSANNIDQIVLFLWNNCQASWPRDQSIRNTSNPNGTAVHGWIQISYDPAVFKWMHDRKTQIPDGSLIIKEQFDGDDPTKPMGWILMLKDQKASFDGWWWGFVSPMPTTSGGCQIDQPSSCASGQIFDPNCVGCHGSANNRQLTFSSLEHIAPKITKPTRGAKSSRAEATATRRSLHIEKLHRRLAELRRGAEKRPIERSPAAPEILPSQTLDKVVSPPGGPIMPGFVSSNVCSGCHDAANLEFCETSEGCTTPWPEMSLPFSSPSNPAIQRVNVSPWSEWSVSLMGLSGRDPVFQAQRESETKLHPELAGYIDNLCYHCHGVMGQRTLAQNSTRDYTHGVFLTTSGADTNLGGLGRDGVSCTVCHRISGEKLGTEASYTGNFELAKPNVIFGPFDKPKDYVMTNSIGMTPEKNNVIKNSDLCGSCHIVETPILMPGQKYTPEEANKAPKSHEQTTFFEWRNSEFRATKSCQSCHMPQTFGTSPEKLSFELANIEDDTYTDFPNTTDESAITLAKRSPYSRHVFFGANPFVLQLFRLDVAKNNPPLTGFSDVDPNYADPASWVNRFDLAIDEELRFARTAAKVQVSVKKGASFDVEVRVFNLAGHKVPSGVGFRRAFIELSVLDANNKVVWASGRTDSTGLIVDLAGQPLPTELSETQFEPYHAVIDSDRAVQIYEERYFDGAKKLSTSFLAIQDIVKDSRLLPRGWSKKGPDADKTKPVGEVGPTYFDGSGSDRVLYRVPSPAAQSAVKVVAVLNYQALPPYYVRDRLRDGRGGPATAAFEQLLRQNNHFDGTPMAGNKIELARAEAAVSAVKTMPKRQNVDRVTNPQKLRK